MSAIKGYVVRGLKRGGDARIASGLCLTADDACAAAVTFREDRHTDVRIFAVAEDGAETPLPTYEEALAILNETRAQTCTPMPLEELPAFMQRVLSESLELDKDVERLRACPLAALVRTFRSDPANPEARGPVWTAFDRVVAAVPEDRCDEVLVEAIEDLRFALNARLMQMREALDERDALLAEGPAPCS